MARTSRSGAPNANVQALDNLDLDDMFADGGDDLFDGLDIDLGGMDDIAANNAAQAQGTGGQDGQSAATSAASSPAPAPAPAEAPKRRKTKRKTSAPVFFDDQDEEYAEEPTKKKKRNVKATTKKRGSKKAAATVQAETKASAAPKKAKAKSTMPPPAAKNSSGGAATVGTGGRQKKSSKNAPAKAEVASAKSSTPAPAPKASKEKTPPSAPPHPGLNQSSFCGLLPSKTLFYPFLPSLPQEVALKNRKIYSLLDRSHSSFTGQLSSTGKATTTSDPPVKETDIIVKLMQEAFKDEKFAGSAGDAQSKSDIIGSAVAHIRKTIEFIDRTKLAQDLLAVCALLKRQHDFLKQNSANMESWCLSNFSEDDYAEVYLPGKAKRKTGDDGQTSPPPGKPVLASLAGSIVRVKLLCSGFKEPKTGLLAAIPDQSAAASSADAKKPAKLTKKRKGAPGEEAKASDAAAPGVGGVVSPQPLSYAQLRPAKRRKAVADLISRTAHSLESDYARRIEQRRQSSATREKRAREAVEDESYQVAHTAGMWRWLEEMGYCEDKVDDTTLLDRLEDSRSMDWGRLQFVGNTIQLADTTSDCDHIVQSNVQPPPSFVDSLMDLLVDEGSCSSDDNDRSVDGGDESHSYPVSDERQVVELSGLSREERAYLHLRSVGLSQRDMSAVPTKAAPRLDVPARSLSSFESKVAEGDEVESVIEAMKSELVELSSLNHRRAEHLEAVARATLETPKECKVRKQVESSLHARHAILLKKSKEAKAKNGKKNAKNDDLALPW